LILFKGLQALGISAKAENAPEETDETIIGVGRKYASIRFMHNISNVKVFKYVVELCAWKGSRLSFCPKRNSPRKTRLDYA
jgi:hypothetical protein